jgi:type I restriction enzyme S subunit
MEVKAGYKHTDVGVIPEDWNVRLLDDLSEKIMVGIASAATHAYRPQGIPLLRNQNIKKGYLQDDDLLFIHKEYEAIYKNKRLRTGDLLTARTGYPGTTCIVPPKYDGAQCFTTIITRLKKNEINSNYLCHYINSEHGLAFIEKSKIGGGQKNIGVGIFQGMPIPIPSPAEQKAIAEALSDADALIEALEQILAKKRQIKQGAMQELLTGKKRLPGFEAELGNKMTAIGIIPKDWKTPELGSILKSMQLGGNYRNSERETNWPLIKMGNLERGSININKLEFIDPSQHPSSRDKLRENDVLFNTRNTLELVGKVAIWRNELPEAYFNSNLMRMEFDNAQVSSNRFMNYNLNTSQSIKGLREVAIGTTSVAAIYSRDLVKLRLPLPSKEEQTAIAEILSDMDAEIAALEGKLAKARQVKQGMMQELLTGRIRLV